MISKIRRTFTSILPVEEGRIGSCNGCGACCELPTRCSFLRTDSKGNNTCAVYRFRPLNCRKFPRSPEQLKEVAETCSFSFKKKLTGEKISNY